MDHGATPFIPFRVNVQPDRHRSLIKDVETTFSMIKSKFGERLRTKTATAQVNEALWKVLCHNICVIIQTMYELNITPEFMSDAI